MTIVNELKSLIGTSPCLGCKMSTNVNLGGWRSIDGRFLSFQISIVAMSGLILTVTNEFTVGLLGTSRSDDSTGDRLSYRYTCAVLVAFALIVSNREFTRKRIQCWVRPSRLFGSTCMLLKYLQVPAFFTQNYEEYTNNVSLRFPRTKQLTPIRRIGLLGTKYVLSQR